MPPFHAMTAPTARLGLLLCLIIFGLLTPSLAQMTTTITPDGSLGTTVTPNGSIHTIGGGTILGPNQFHSFGRFDVGSGDTARFTGPASVANILSRVTGGAASMIDGTLQSAMARANLYLLNPSGVIFGPNAQLDVMGSFHVSTADVIRLQDGGSFAATQPEQSVLSVAAPSAFGFLRESPEGIHIEGSQLAVPTDQTISIVGGDIEIVGDRTLLLNNPARLLAPSGQLHVVSVASPGEVMSESSDTEASVAVDRFTHLGTITIADHALVDVSSEDGSGTVVIRADRLMIDDSSIFAATEGIRDGNSIGIDIEVAKDLILTNETLIATGVFASGNAGDIRVKAAKWSYSMGQ